MRLYLGTRILEFFCIVVVVVVVVEIKFHFIHSYFIEMVYHWLKWVVSKLSKKYIMARSPKNQASTFCVKVTRSCQPSDEYTNELDTKHL